MENNKEDKKEDKKENNKEDKKDDNKNNEDMRVTKRNGQLEDISFDKILRRVKKLGQEVNIQINYSALIIKVIDQLYDTISTTKIDELTAEQCASLSTQHPDYSILAGRIVVSNHHKNTRASFNDVMSQLYFHTDNTGNMEYSAPLISHDTWINISKNAVELEEMIDYNRDYLIDYFGFKTLENSYLLKINKVVVERPQHIWLRVSIGIHGDNMSAVKETYDLMSQKYFTHATPTLFNAGTPRAQLSSCFLLAMEDDSLDGIYNTLHDCASISKYAGGIGLHIHNIRANNSFIKGTNGHSTGIVPMLRVFNDTARFINQSGKRNGSFAIYLEPWHPDINDFLDLKKNHGEEELRARDLFYALWISDLFMERVKSNGKWTLFCPNECPGLADVYGAEFSHLYTRYENEGRARNTINARDLWYKILDSQMETGTPYMLYKDAINMKSNQKNLGTIKSSNLCCEITEYSDDKETAVCNLASIALPSFVNVSVNINGENSSKTFDYEKLHSVTKVVTNNLNRIIDINFYPTPKTRRSNLLHRPIGIGVQGLADTFIMMDIAFHSDEAREINKLIFETMYHAALERSNEIAIERKCAMLTIHKQIYKKNVMDKIQTQQPDEYIDLDLDLDLRSELGQNLVLENISPIAQEIMNLELKHAGAYSSFENSPASKGILQFDMWQVEPSARYDWTILKDSIKDHGLRNSLLLAPMPTASTSQILGFNECFEPLTSNIYSRRTLAGEFVVANKYLMRELIGLGLWNEKIKNNIIANKGSIQQLTNLPEHIRNKYKIVWEMPMKHLIDMSADRGAFICQSQSLNLWLEDPNYNTLTSMHFYAWKKGLKTGIYYLRRKAKHQAQQFSIEPEKNTNGQDNKQDNEEDDICEMCSA
uniref:ribonucleoside-diphosphate reductase n=1 Tax=viral metagenome TaxID=1070528 RepID=A0A6C0EW60_9ZZZZ